MSNPRKFSEKIALHTQKQAEETAAFQKIMEEVTGATKACKDDAPLVGTNSNRLSNEFDAQSIRYSGNLLATPQIPQRSGSMPNVHQNSEPERGACGVDVRAAICNLALMRQGRDPNRSGANNRLANHLSVSNASMRPSSATPSRGTSPVAPLAASRSSTHLNPGAMGNGMESLSPRPLSRSQHNLSHNGIIGRNSLLQSARAECQPYLLKPPSNESQWRRTNSDSALHQSAMAAEQQQHQQHQQQLHHLHQQQQQQQQQHQQQQQQQQLNNSPHVSIAHNQMNTNVQPSSHSPIPQLIASPYNPHVQSHSAMQLNTIGINPISSQVSTSPAQQQTQMAGMHHHVNGMIMSNVNHRNTWSPSDTSSFTLNSANAHPVSNYEQIVSNLNNPNVNSSGLIQTANNLSTGNHVPTSSINHCTLSSNVVNNDCLTNGIAYGSPNVSNNSYMLRDDLTNAYVQNGFIDTSVHHTSTTSSSSTSAYVVPRERPQSCDLPISLNASLTNCSLPNSQLNSPMSMQPSPMHSPPSYGANTNNNNIQSPQSVPVTTCNMSIGGTNVNVSSSMGNSDTSTILYQVPVSSPQQPSPPAYPGSNGSNGNNGTNGNMNNTNVASSPSNVTTPSRPESTTLSSSAGSPPQFIPQSPQSQVPLLSQASSPSPGQSDQYSLDFDNLEDCFADLDDSNPSLFTSPTSPQSPISKTSLIINNHNELTQNSDSQHSLYRSTNEGSFDNDNGVPLSSSQMHLQHQTKLLEQRLQQFKMADQIQNGHFVLLSNQDQNCYNDPKLACQINNMNSTQAIQATTPQTPTTIPDIILTAPTTEMDGLRDCSGEQANTNEVLNFDDLQFYSDYCRDQGFSLDNS